MGVVGKVRGGVIVVGGIGLIVGAQFGGDLISRVSESAGDAQRSSPAPEPPRASAMALR
jgi:hypothetical protein